MIVLAFCTNHPTAVALVNRALRSEYPGKIVRLRTIQMEVDDIINGANMQPYAIRQSGQEGWLRRVMNTECDILIIGDCTEWCEIEYAHEQGIFLLADQNHWGLIDYVIKPDFGYAEAIALVHEVADAT